MPIFLDLQDKNLPRAIKQATNRRWGGYHLFVNLDACTVIVDLNYEVDASKSSVLGFYVVPSEDYGVGVSRIEDIYYKQLISTPYGLALYKKIHEHLNIAAVNAYEDTSRPYTPFNYIEFLNKHKSEAKPCSSSVTVLRNLQGLNNADVEIKHVAALPQAVAAEIKDEVIGPLQNAAALSHTKAISIDSEVIGPLEAAEREQPEGPEVLALATSKKM